MSEDKHLDNIISRLESKVLDNVEVRNPTTKAQLIQLVSKYEGRYTDRRTQAINPKDIVKTAFVTKNSIYASTRMPFGLPKVAPNFQKAIEIILKPVLGRYVSVYVDDAIISSPSLTHHVKHLREVFKLLQEAGFTLNQDKCHFAREKLKYLGLVVRKD
ncbi:retrovirus-related Pol polyprotein from transposon 17.6 [Trichonephila clavipes]|nr:retrovirus-related Pol polyprotein from transposon 17.6 [Trichonephila clavipes]